MSARRNLVLASIEISSGERCVDIFQRPDGTFGFEEYRRDSEDGGGWFCIGSFAGQIFASEADARAAAWGALPWLMQVANR
ncbi:MAG: hypothetical protein AB7L90_23025 [Hyphomicrobiaceae bacterium]